MGLCCLCFSVGNATQGLPTDSSQGFEVILDRSDIVLDHTWANAFLYCKITIPGVGSWQQPPELEIRVIVEGGVWSIEYIIHYK